MVFADELISLRKAAGFRTVAEFSHQISELGYPVSYFELRRYEKGEYLPTLPAFAAIVDALGYSTGSDAPGALSTAKQIPALSVGGRDSKPPARCLGQPLARTKPSPEWTLRTA
jgi:hypothetical protein